MPRNHARPLGAPREGRESPPEQRNPRQNPNLGQEPSDPRSPNCHACRGRVFFLGGSWRFHQPRPLPPGPRPLGALYWFTEVLIPSQSSCLTTEPRLYSCLHLINGAGTPLPFPSHPPSPLQTPAPVPAGKNSPRKIIPASWNPPGLGKGVWRSTEGFEHPFSPPKKKFLAPLRVWEHLGVSVSGISELPWMQLIQLRARHPRKRPEMRPGGREPS